MKSLFILFFLFIKLLNVDAQECFLHEEKFKADSAIFGEGYFMVKEFSNDTSGIEILSCELFQGPKSYDSFTRVTISDSLVKIASFLSGNLQLTETYLIDSTVSYWVGKGFQSGSFEQSDLKYPSNSFRFYSLKVDGKIVFEYLVHGNLTFDCLQDRDQGKINLTWDFVTHFLSNLPK